MQKLSLLACILACSPIFCQKNYALFAGFGSNFGIIGSLHAEPVGVFSKIGDLRIWQNFYFGAELPIGQRWLSVAPEIYLLQKGRKLKRTYPETETVGFASWVSWGITCPLVLNLQNSGGSGIRLAAGGFADVAAGKYFSKNQEVEKVPLGSFGNKLDLGWQVSASFVFEDWIELRFRYQPGLRPVVFEVPSRFGVNGQWRGTLSAWLLSFHYRFLRD